MFNFADMHELSIAEEIIEIVTDYVTKESASKAEKIVLEIGKLSGIETESLNFALESYKNNTVFSNCEIIINEIEGVAVCNSCKTKFTNNDWYTCCPICGRMDCEVISGKEFRIKSITIF